MDERDDPPPAGWADAPIATGRSVIQRGDGTEWPVDFDRALWVEMDGERGYILDNAHTHPGRFHLWFPDQERYSTAVSVYDLTAISAESRYWLAGFLSGSEPDLYEYLGLVGSVEIKGFEAYDQTDEEWIRYQGFVERYRSQGSHIRLNQRPDRALVITDEERAEIRLDHLRPWSYVGERVLVAEGAEWVEADPQPEMDGPWLAGSVCAEREHDQLMWLESGWLVCRDCGEVTVYWHVEHP